MFGDQPPDLGNSLVAGAGFELLRTRLQKDQDGSLKDVAGNVLSCQRSREDDAALLALRPPLGINGSVLEPAETEPDVDLGTANRVEVRRERQ